MSCVHSCQLATPPQFQSQPHPEGKPSTWYQMGTEGARWASGSPAGLNGFIYFLGASTRGLGAK